MLEAIEGFERQRSESLLPGVQEWEGELGVAVVAGDLDIEKLGKLVERGAKVQALPFQHVHSHMPVWWFICWPHVKVHDLAMADLETMSEGGDVFDAHAQRLRAVYSQWREAIAWHERCVKVVGGPQSSESLNALLEVTLVSPLSA